MSTRIDYSKWDNLKISDSDHDDDPGSSLLLYQELKRFQFLQSIRRQIKSIYVKLDPKKIGKQSGRSKFAGPK